MTLFTLDTTRVARVCATVCGVGIRKPDSRSGWDVRSEEVVGFLAERLCLKLPEK